MCGLCGRCLVRPVIVHSMILMCSLGHGQMADYWAKMLIIIIKC